MIPTTVSKLKAGLYLHTESEQVIVLTPEWEGPKGGRWARWEVGSYDCAGNLCVDGCPDLYRTLAEAAAALDKLADVDRESAEGVIEASEEAHTGPLVAPVV